MMKQIFVNLPVKDLPASMEFFGKLGFQLNEQFTNDNAACLVVTDNIFVMLLREDFFQTFTKKEVADATRVTEVLSAFSVETKEAVDELLALALEAGGNEAREAQDLDFMYARSFEDLDGHIWEIVWMDPRANLETK